MKNIVSILLIFCLTSFATDTFRSEQRKFPRVRKAYEEKGNLVQKILSDNLIQVENLRVYLRAFKYNKELELWAKNADDERFKLIKTYKICRTSGKLGPKRKQGDRQIPEGFYFIDRFNPSSNFYLSLGLNYPNQSDKMLGTKNNLGGDIFIHGSCVTIGCIPITDELIKELYIFCVEAKSNGQKRIPVTIYPAKLTNDNFQKLKNKYKDDSDKINLWEDLKKSYDNFNETKKLPKVEFLNNGRHKIN